eukprot:TRINITY_DN8189_c0_g1_i2.p1 TRINITY_DN8189_c0_g1~~TRINITY_DN8189_c0_g1_i2.p1  ORF type:complete len:280 (+),score=56.26 TRINITY_DN8189_c0_g1_i2:95-841(+)
MCIRDRKKEAVSLVTSQFLSVKEFAERMNTFVREGTNAMKQGTLKDLMIYLSKAMKPVFYAERIHLWAVDRLTGLLYTYNQDKNEMRCLGTKGLFGEVVKYGKAANKRDFKQGQLYEPASPDDIRPHVDNALVFPIKNQEGRVYGILELSNLMNELFGFDEEYFGLMLTHLITILTQKLAESEIMQTEIRIKGFIHKAFNEFVACADYHQLSKKVSEYARLIFGSATSRLLLVENNKFLHYQQLKYAF